MRVQSIKFILRIARCLEIKVDGLFFLEKSN